MDGRILRRSRGKNRPVDIDNPTVHTFYILTIAESLQRLRVYRPGDEGQRHGQDTYLGKILPDKAY